MFLRFARHVKEHLLPTKHNGFVPHLLRESQVFAMLGIGVALFSFVQLVRVTDYFGLSADVYPAVVVTLTNKDRSANSLSLLSTNKTLEAAAKLKAEDMARKGYFAHTSPEGLTPWYWFGRAGYKFIYAGENLAVHYDDSEDVQKAWLDSPTHRANIMNTNFTEMGVAVATGVYNGQQTTFVVEMFGMPATAKVVSAPIQQITTPTPVEAPGPKPVTTVVALLEEEAEVAGESATPISVLEETTEFVIAQNNDPTLEPGIGTLSPAPKLSWWQLLILNSGKIAGLIIQMIIVVAIIATAGMVAREYEKHHKKHMAYGALMAVIMFAFLFVGGIGVFDTGVDPLTAAASLLVK